MNLSKLPFALLTLVPTLAIGCAEPTADDAQSTQDDLSVGLSFSAAVGAVEIGGERICSATLVDVDANAKIGSVSVSGRQIVLGGACIGRMSNGYKGGAVFVTAQAGVSLHTPIAAVDLSAGVGVGILAAPLQGVKPLKPYAGAQVTTATLLKANSNGEQVAAGVAIEAGIGFHIKTRCTELRWKTAFSVGVGVAGDSDDSFGIVSVGGELQFAASIDAGCVVRHVGKAVLTVVRLPLQAAGAILDGLASIGSGDMIASWELTDGRSVVSVHFYEPATELRLNARGFMSAATQVLPNGEVARCEALIGSCTLRPTGGFRAGQTINVAVDTSGGLFSNETTVLASVP